MSSNNVEGNSIDLTDNWDWIELAFEFDIGLLKEGSSKRRKE